MDGEGDRLLGAFVAREKGFGDWKGCEPVFLVMICCLVLFISFLETGMVAGEDGAPTASSPHTST